MKNHIIKFLFIASLLLLFISCNFDDDKIDKVEIISLSVAPETVTVILPITGLETEWLAVTEGNNNYALPLNWIEGFEYEAGYEYNLQVKKVTPGNPIQDAPDSLYYLMEILSKEKKE